jgi:protein CWC15
LKVVEMTTAHRPTWHPAVGTANQGGYRYHVARQQFSARDLPGHLHLKTRQTGQGTQAEISVRDLKKELEFREKKAKGLVTNDVSMRIGAVPEDEEVPARAETAFDPEDENNYDDEDEDLGGADEDDDEEDEEDDDDDEEELLRQELEKIRREREEERKRQEEEEALMQGIGMQRGGVPVTAEQRFVGAFMANPLEARAGVKRRWDDDVVFRNQAKDESAPKKRFINDTIRNDFHLKFMKRYIK